MLPRPNRNKIHKVVRLEQGRELLTAEVFGYKNENSLDNPGGGGGYDSFFIRDTKKKQQEATRKQFNYLLNVEQRLKDLSFRHDENKKEFARLMENYQSRKSQERTVNQE